MSDLKIARNCFGYIQRQFADWEPYLLFL